MTTDERTEKRYDRRRLLALAGTGTAAALAGCSGGSNDGDDRDDDSGEGTDDPFGGLGDDGDDPSGDDGNGGDDPAGDDGDDPFGDDEDGWDEFTCDDLTGEMRTYDPGPREFVFSFAYPDTWDDSDPDGSADETNPAAFFGHAATRDVLNLPAYALDVDQRIEPESEDLVEYWLLEDAVEIRRFDFGGAEATAALWDSDPDGGEGHVWWISLPTDEGWYQAKVETYRPYGSTEDRTAERPCDDALVELGWAVIDSFEPRE